MGQRTPTLVLIECGLACDEAHREALASLAATIVEARDIDAALATIEVARPDLIVLCASSASAAPEQLADALTANAVRPPTILVTRRASVADIRRALRLGFCDYHALRDDPTELVAAIRRALQSAPEPGVEAVPDDVDYLVSLITHELRTPLMTINGYLELLKKYHGRLPDEKTRDFLERSLQAMDEATAIAETMTQVVHLEAGHDPPPPERLNLAEEASLVVEQSRRQADGHEIRCLVPPDVLVLAEPMALRLILRNLLNNAIKYSPNGGIITLFAETQRDNTVVIGVRDQGIGIAPEQMSRLFTRFTRVHDQARWPSIRGTGLGLYLCRHLAEAMGGRIWVESLPGKGSVFYIALPRVVTLARASLAGRRQARSAVS